MVARVEIPNEDAGRAADILRELQEMGMDDVTMDQALALARREKRALLEGMTPSQNKDEQISQLRAQIERIQAETGKKEGFLTSVLKFPLRHPFLTTAGVLGGLYLGGPALLRLFGSTESSFGTVALDWMKRMGGTISSLSSGTGFGPVPTPGGLGGPPLPGTV